MPIRQFKVTVNGRDYDVAVQELTAGAAAASTEPANHQPQAAARPVAMAPTPTAAAPAAPTTAAAPGTHGSFDEVAHMGGVVVQLDVALGQDVALGDRLLVLEAMKMKTYLLASRAGKVTRLLVAAGDTVESGQPLISIE